MKETTSLLSKIGASRGGKEPLFSDGKKDMTANWTKVLAGAAASVLLALLAGYLPSSPSSHARETMTRMVPKAKESVTDSTFRLTQEQELELWMVGSSFCIGATCGTKPNTNGGLSQRTRTLLGMPKKLRITPSYG